MFILRLTAYSALEVYTTGGSPPFFFCFTLLRSPIYGVSAMNLINNTLTRICHKWQV